MEDNKTKEVVSAEQYRKDSLYGSLYDSTHFDVTDTIDIMLEEYAVMRVEQSTKHLQDRVDETDKVLTELARFIPSLRVCVDKEFQSPENCFKVLDDIEKLLNTKS